MKKLIAITCIMTLMPLCVFAKWTSQGEITLEMRQFEDDKKTTTTDQGIALFSRIESRFEGESLKMVMRGYGRTDRRDTDRDVLFLEDAYVEYPLMEGDHVFLLGYQIFNWSSLEVFSPTDIINSSNFDSDLEDPEKNGELTVSYTKKIGSGNFSLFYWPHYERPSYPGDKSRLGVGQDIDSARFVESSTTTTDMWGHQYGLKISQVWGDWDVSVFGVQHLDRNFPIVGNAQYTAFPLLSSPCSATLCPNNGKLNIPYYFRTTEIGLTATWVIDSLILKLEGVNRKFKKDLNVLTLSGLVKPVDHSEVALGSEYNYTHESGMESSFFLEYNTIVGTTTTEKEALSTFQNDVFLGYRLAFNDADGSELTLGSIIDVERTHEFFYNAKYAWRLSNEWKATTGLRVYDAPKKASLPVGLEVLDGDNQVYLNLSRFF